MKVLIKTLLLVRYLHAVAFCICVLLETLRLFSQNVTNFASNFFQGETTIFTKTKFLKQGVKIFAMKHQNKTKCETKLSCQKTFVTRPK